MSKPFKPNTIPMEDDLGLINQTWEIIDPSFDEVSGEEEDTLFNEEWKRLDLEDLDARPSRN